MLLRNLKSGDIIGVSFNDVYVLMTCMDMDDCSTRVSLTDEDALELIALLHTALLEKEAQGC